MFVFQSFAAHDGVNAAPSGDFPVTESKSFPSMPNVWKKDTDMFEPQRGHYEESGDQNGRLSNVLTELPKTGSQSIVKQAKEIKNTCIAKLNISQETNTFPFTCPADEKIKTRVSADDKTGNVDSKNQRSPNNSSQRFGLTRQISVSKPSDESDKTDSNSDTGRKSKKGDNSSKFKNIEPHDRFKNKDRVSLVAPTATVDKSTQVTDQEILAETEWDFLEGVYLLLRRISVKVPNHVDLDLQQTDCPTTLTGKIKCFDVVVPQYSASVEREDVPNERASHLPGQLTSANRDSQNLEMKNNERHGDEGNGKMRKRDNRSDQTDVNAWLEKNGEFLGGPEVPVPRQATMETEDSGFDDNPANFNRLGRFSLPAVWFGRINL